MFKFRFIKYFSIILIALLCACTSNNKESDTNASPAKVFSEAKGISVKTDAHQITTINILNPWQEGSVLKSYTINGTSANNIKIPLRRVLVYSTVHANAIKELGHLDAIKGVCDVQYFTIPEIVEGVENGNIVNAGASTAPITEKIIALSPDAIIVSPYQNSKFDNLERLGIPVIQCADYMENTPLGRAEWIKLFGILFNEEERADSIYNSVASQYNALKHQASEAKSKPKVLSENVINGTWYVPGGNSYMAKLFADAGAEYAWSETQSSGSTPLDMPQVLEKAHDADIWLIKTLENSFSYNKLKAQNPLNAEFKAFKDRKVYHCDTKSTTLFQDFPFHPEMLLKEYIAIFHPELITNYTTKYFQPLANE